MKSKYQQTFSAYNPQRPKKKFKGWGWGCILILIAPVIIVAIIVVLYIFVYPNLFPNSIKGDLVDMTYVQEKDKKGKLWILSDDSFYYVSSYERPGYKSWGTECLFCKHFLYIYDPVEDKVIKKIEIDYDDVPPKPKLFFLNGIIWKVNREHLDNEPGIFQYDAESGKEILNTEGFINKFPRLAAGIVGLSINDNPLALDLKTYDGYDYFYSFVHDTLFAERRDMNEFYQKTDVDVTTVFALAEESGTPRKKLYKVTGPGSRIMDERILNRQLDDPEYLKRHFDATAKLITPDRVFIEGVVLCYNDEAAVILHQNRIGKKADRILTCVEADGRERWTIPPNKLFEELKIDKEEDPFSDIFFMKDKISASIEGDIMIFKLVPEGIIGFDFKTGEKLWTIEL
jgi:hypothetical protein